MRWWIAISLCWTTLARADADAALLAKVEAERARGQDARAEKRLLAGLRRAPTSQALLQRYAELAVPCDGHATQAKASELLRRVGRASGELERRLALHAALAEALLGQHGESVARLTGAVQRQDPESAACARHVAALAIRNDELPLATEALVLASEVLPQDAAIRAELAQLWLARGRLDRALPLLAERFALATGELPARRDLAYALAADGRPDEALSLLVPAREACRQDAACALTAARIALEGDRLDDALDYLQAHLAREPHDLDALFALADVHTRAHQLDQARATYGQILALRPESARAAQALRALAP